LSLFDLLDNSLELLVMLTSSANVRIITLEVKLGIISPLNKHFGSIFIHTLEKVQVIIL
jgi:hypothetical protein